MRRRTRGFKDDGGHGRPGHPRSLRRRRPIGRGDPGHQTVLDVPDRESTRGTGGVQVQSGDYILIRSKQIFFNNSQ